MLREGWRAELFVLLPDGGGGGGGARARRQLVFTTHPYSLSPLLRFQNPPASLVNDCLFALFLCDLVAIGAIQVCCF